MTERKPSPLNLRKVPASSDGQTKRVSPKSTYYETVNPANLLRGLKVSVVSERRFRLIAAACAWLCGHGEDAFTAERWAGHEGDVEARSYFSQHFFFSLWSGNPREFAVFFAEFAVSSSTPLSAAPLVCNIIRDIIGPPDGLPIIPRHLLTEDILRMAETIYEDRLEHGVLCSEQMLVLSDALEEAGFADELFLDLRCKRDRYRGYWVLDVLLGKE